MKIKACNFHDLDKKKTMRKTTHIKGNEKSCFRVKKKWRERNGKLRVLLTRLQKNKKGKTLFLRMFFSSLSQVAFSDMKVQC